MDSRKRQNTPASAPGTLRMVATPIGNRGDLSPRAREAIAGSSAVLCEDTRRTGAFLSGLGIARPLVHFDAHATPRDMQNALQKLGMGEDLVFVSDAGTPGVSDPGARLARAAHAEGFRVEGVPGPSAVPTALSISGIETQGFAFWGFFPRKNPEATLDAAELAAAAGARASVWFEAPARVLESIARLLERWPNAHACVVKELTKIHERAFVGPIREISGEIQAHFEKEGALGEWTFVVDVPPRAMLSATESEWKRALTTLLRAGIRASDASKEISSEYSVPKRDVYAFALTLPKNSSGGA